MYKRLALLFFCFFASSSLLAETADQKKVAWPPTQCPDIVITSLVPLKITTADKSDDKWKITVHDFDKASTNYAGARYALQDDVKVPKQEIDDAAATTNRIETPQLADVMPFEYHVLTDSIGNPNRATVAPLKSCQYGLLWTKYNIPLYYKEIEGTRVIGGKVLRGFKTGSCLIHCMEKYYYLYHSLVELSPKTSVYIDVPSILDNYTGWTQTRRDYFDCSHDQIGAPKCTWTIGQSPPPPRFNWMPMPH